MSLRVLVHLRTPEPRKAFVGMTRYYSCGCLRPSGAQSATVLNTTSAERKLVLVEMTSSLDRPMILLYDVVQSEQVSCVGAPSAPTPPQVNPDTD
jgi:hypothetical protein